MAEEQKPVGNKGLKVVQLPTAPKKGGGGGGQPPKVKPERLCCARVRYCLCGYRFPKDDRSVKRDHKLEERRKKGFAESRLGECAECGRTRRLCANAAVVDRHVCRMHGGKAGRKPIVPTAALDEEALDAIAAMQAAKDDDLSDEFYVVKYFLQHALAQFSDSKDKVEFAERMVGLMDRAVSIQERRARLSLIVPPDMKRLLLEFDDPRVAMIIKENIVTATTEAIKGTVSMILEAAKRAGIAESVLEVLPPRLRAYAVPSAEVTPSAGAEPEVTG